MSVVRSASRRTVVVAVALLAVGVTPGVAAAHQDARGDPGVVLAWNAIAWRTIGVEAQKPPPVAQLHLGLVSLAVDDAVQESVRRHASAEAAAATAAHDVLVEYFPASAAALDADHASSLGGIPDDAARHDGQEIGARAADRLIASRVDDGRDAPITLPRPAEPPAGMWVPTGTGEFLAPWLGSTRPLVVDSPTQFAGDGPDPLTSEAYAADLAEVAAMGSATSTSRSAAQTEQALFWSDNPVRQYQDAMRDRLVRHGTGIVGAARMFAATNVAGADALITCWRVKVDTVFWRPVTAIQQADRDGNPATVQDAAWTSLRPAPPYPENPSGHGCVTAAVVEALDEVVDGDLDIDVTSLVTGTSRHYDTEEAWLDDAGDARIWLGIHFRDAMDDARRIGHDVAEAVVESRFESED